VREVYGPDASCLGKTSPHLRREEVASIIGCELAFYHSVDKAPRLLLTMPDRSPLVAVARDLRRSCKELVLTDIAYKVIAFVVLTPIVGILFRVMVAASGRSVLTDQDILYFFLGPVGWICFIAISALWLGIVALEQAALLGIVGAASGGKRLGVVRALRFASRKARVVVFVSARVIALALLAITPFAAAAALIYRMLLAEFDINYYLAQKPGEFQVALGIGAVLAAALVAVVLRLTANWFFALPLVLFEGVRPAHALKISRERAFGHRRTLLAWISGWALASVVVSTLASSLVILLGRWCVPYAIGSLWLLTTAVGLTLVFWFGINLIVNLLSTVVFATMLFNLYRQLGSRGSIDLGELNAAEVVQDETVFGLTPMKLLGLAGTSVLLVVAIGVLAVHSVRLDDRVVIMAHRGSSHSAPENTMAAIRQAIADGADWVEIDVQETADGEVVVFHDSDFMKRADMDLKIWDATMSDLEHIDIGSSYAAEFSQERVPTLGAVLDECQGKVGVNIELKYYGHDQQLEQRVVNVVESRGMASEVVVMSLNLDAVARMKSLRPNWKVGLLMSVSAGKLQNVGADFLGINANFVNRRLIRSARDAGQEIYVWTVNDAPTMSSMMTRGVDGIITDKPALARSVIAWRSKLSSIERLLLELAGVLGVTPEIGSL
jgi:glycerophosphoryl diester phosphodiesterase